MVDNQKLHLKLGPRRRVKKIVASDLNRLCGFSYRRTYLFLFIYCIIEDAWILWCVSKFQCLILQWLYTVSGWNLLDHIFQKSGPMSVQTPPKFFGSVFLETDEYTFFWCMQFWIIFGLVCKLHCGFMFRRASMKCSLFFWEFYYDFLKWRKILCWMLVADDDYGDGGYG